MNVPSSLSLSFLTLLACACAQDPVPKVEAKPAPIPQQDADKVLAEVRKQLQQEGITYDEKARTIAVKAVVNQPQDPIEYLLIHRKGKRHEAMFVTKSKPSVLNAALLMLGLKPGKNASYVEKNPPPTLEEVQNGADPIVVTPPQGEPFWLTVRWRLPPEGDQKEGTLVEHCVEDLLLDRTTGKAAVDCSWIYLGGRMAALYRDEPEVYVADFEGNLVSVCYLQPDNHLGTMAHANARDDQNWWMTTLVPAPETEVEVVFHRTMPPLQQERLQRLAKAAAAKGAGEAKSDGSKPESKQPEGPQTEGPK